MDGDDPFSILGVNRDSDYIQMVKGERKPEQRKKEERKNITICNRIV